MRNCIENRGQFQKGHKLNIGRKHTEEEKKKMRVPHIGSGIYIRTSPVWNKGKKFSDKHRENLKLAHIGKILTLEHRINMSKGQKGEKGSNWKGGISPITHLIRTSFKYKEWVKNVFIRDSFTCQECGIKGTYLEAHHKKPFYRFIEEIKINLSLLDLYEGAMVYTPLWDISNGITYCKKCHKKISTRR